MRRMGIVALAVAAAFPLASPAAAVVGQEAFGVWVRKEGGNHVAYFAMIERYVDPVTGVASFVGVGKGKCRLQKGKGFRMLSCMGRVWGKDVGLTEASFDPALSEASFTARIKGFEHTVQWTAADAAPTGFAYAQAGPDGAGAAVGMARYVTAGGSVFGTDLEHDDHWDFADMAQGTGLFVESPVLFDKDEGTFRIEVRL